MSTSEFDTNPENGDLNIGIEVEFPEVGHGEYLRDIGYESHDLGREVQREGLGVYNTHVTRDPSVGLEVVAAEPMPLGEASDWYSSVIYRVENDFGTEYQPTGIINNNTAGTHIHLSELSDEQARNLYEISLTDWGQVFFCTSIATDECGNNVPVFRGANQSRFCGLENFTPDRGSYEHSRYNVLNNRGRGHWEWRLPEPMLPEHMEKVIQFLRLFEQDVDAAIGYARGLLYEGNEDITSIARADAIGFVVQDTGEIDRRPSEESPGSESFFNAVESTLAAPRIYRAIDNGAEYYAFDSDTLPAGVTFEIGSVSFSTDDILRADTLEPVEDSETASAVSSALDEHVASMRTDGGHGRETEGTKYLKELMEKKK